MEEIARGWFAEHGNHWALVNTSREGPHVLALYKQVSSGERSMRRVPGELRHDLPSLTDTLPGAAR